MIDATPSLPASDRRRTAPTFGPALLAAAVAIATAPVGAHAGEPPAWGGAEARAWADAQDLALPGYPGARPAPVGDGEQPAFSGALWAGFFGFRLAVRKSITDDAMPDVAAFYRRALARRGGLRDCGAPPEGDDGGRVACGDERPPPGGHLFKAGVDDDFNVVSLVPKPEGVLIQAVRVSLGRSAAR